MTAIKLTLSHRRFALYNSPSGRLRRPARRISKQVLADTCECSTRPYSATSALSSTPTSHSTTILLNAPILPDKGWNAPLVSLTVTDSLALAFLRSQIVDRARSDAYAAQIESALTK